MTQQTVEEDRIEEMQERDARMHGRGQRTGKAAGVDEVGPDLPRANLEGTTKRLTREDVTTGFGTLRGGQKCRRKVLQSRYSRRVICPIVTTGEE